MCLRLSLAVFCGMMRLIFLYITIERFVYFSIVEHGAQWISNVFSISVPQRIALRLSPTPPKDPSSNPVTTVTTIRSNSLCVHVCVCMIWMAAWFLFCAVSHLLAPHHSLRALRLLIVQAPYPRTASLCHMLSARCVQTARCYSVLLSLSNKHTALLLFTKVFSLPRCWIRLCKWKHKQTHCFFVVVFFPFPSFVPSSWLLAMFICLEIQLFYLFVCRTATSCLGFHHHLNPFPVSH